MRDYHLQFGGAALALPAAPAAEICRTGDADAALVYLYLLSRGGTADAEQMELDLKLTAERLDAALRALTAARAIAPEASAAPETKNARPLPPAEDYYTAAELDAAIRGDMRFAWLVSETEKQMGRGIWKHEAEKLMIVYDTLQLPPEVILLLVNRLCADGQKKLSFAKLLSEARAWSEAGIDTVERAEEALRRDAERRTSLGETRSLLGFGDRPLSSSEQRILTEFLDAGSTPALIARAYDITVTKRGAPSWAYTRAILERWRAKGYRTPEDVERGEPAGQRRRPPAAEDRDENYYSELRGYFKGKDDSNADG